MVVRLPCENWKFLFSSTLHFFAAWIIVREWPVDRDKPPAVNNSRRESPFRFKLLIICQLG